MQSHNWYAALTLTLTLPDIAGKVDTPAGGSNARYAQWFDQYIKGKYTSEIGPEHMKHVFLSGNDCYALRCAYLHEGKSEILLQRSRDVLEDFLFVSPKHGLFLHCNQNGNRLQLQVDQFCNDILDGISLWLTNIHSDKTKQDALNGQLKIFEIG